MSGKVTKPNLRESQVSEIVLRLYGLEVSKIRALPSYDDQNFHVSITDGGEYVLKVMNSADSENPALLEVQTHAMRVLHDNGLAAQIAMPTTTGQLMSLEQIDCGFGCKKYLLRLLTYLPGTTISKVLASPQLLYEVGKMAARMDKVLQEMAHPHLSVLQRETFIWSLSNVPLLEPYIYLMDGDPAQEVIEAILEQFKTSVFNNHSAFRKCIIHGDFNDQNVLVEPDEANGYRISGILDFGDMNSGYYVHELAITIMYMMIEQPNPVTVGGPIIAGWESVIPLNEEEKDSLFLLVLCRFCQSLVIARYNVSLQPENEEYLMSTSKTGLQILKQLWDLGKEEVERIWFQGAAQHAERK